MRLFTGVALASDVADRLAATIADLRPAARIKWTPHDNLHITTKFIGEWPDERLAVLTSALGELAIEGPIPIAVFGFGFFPNPRHPHSFFADVRAGPKLVELAAAIDRALMPLGILAETREYRPHVTLARVKPASDIRRLRERIAGKADFVFGSFDAPAFHLYRSEPAEGGSVYTKVATYHLMREKKAI